MKQVLFNKLLFYTLQGESNILLLFNLISLYIFYITIIRTSFTIDSIVFNKVFEIVKFNEFLWHLCFENYDAHQVILLKL